MLIIGAFLALTAVLSHLAFNPSPGCFDLDTWDQLPLTLKSNQVQIRQSWLGWSQAVPEIECRGWFPEQFPCPKQVAVLSFKELQLYQHSNDTSSMLDVYLVNGRLDQGTYVSWPGLYQGKVWIQFHCPGVLELTSEIWRGWPRLSKAHLYWLA